MSSQIKLVHRKVNRGSTAPGNVIIAHIKDGPEMNDSDKNGHKQESNHDVIMFNDLPWNEGSPKNRKVNCRSTTPGM